MFHRGVVGFSFETYPRRRWDLQRDVVTTLARRIVPGWVGIMGDVEKCDCHESNDHRKCH